MEPGLTLTFDGLCELLEKQGLLSSEQRREAMLREDRERTKLLRQQQRDAGPQRGAVGRRDELVHPAEVIAAMGFSVGGDARAPITEKLVMETIALAANLPFVQLDPLEIDGRLAAQTLSRPFARRHTTLVLGEAAGVVTVALANPFDAVLLDDLASYVHGRIALVVASPTEIQRLITDVYGFRTSVKAAEEQARTEVDIGNLERYVRLKRIDEIEATDSHIVNAVEYLLHYALDQRASDVHIEPHRDESIVRMRIDGVLHPVQTLPKVVHAAIVSRLKTLARLDIAEKRRPQDGRIKTARDAREVEIRVSTMSVAFGEKMVLRLFDPEIVLRDLSDLGLFDPQLVLVERFVSRPNGLVLVTGPTGSGKTSTLYAALHLVASPEINIVTIEDPIELIVDQFNQVAVQPKIGITFAESLRHILRQDPDVVMVGEIRDEETATIATQAALTGHLVLASLHTNDSATAVTRMLELGVDPFLLASTLVGVVAQRLVRLVCADCRLETFLTPDELSLLGVDVRELAGQGDSPQLMVAIGEGCVKCRGTGLFGRIGVFETLEVDDKIRKLIVAKAGSRDILKQARQNGLLTLREAALKKLARGLTSFAEVIRATVDG